ncbi:MAG: 3-dehydroquinate dehydratase [Paludibacteraceae bacterium]|nr:3-dehydroquinate dehydratase [Paludibacteraceae bacterium]
MKVLILNGPNLNMLGRRDPEQYGKRSMEQIIVDIQRAHPDLWIEYRQSNHEGDLIDWLQQATDVHGIILNAGGYTHTSVALRDAVELCAVPVVEVHLSNIQQREPFRQQSLLTDVCCHTIMGKQCYEEAVRYIMSLGC